MKSKNCGAMQNLQNIKIYRQDSKRIDNNAVIVTGSDKTYKQIRTIMIESVFLTFRKWINGK